MPKTAINQFDTTPGNNTDVDGVGVGAAMTVDNTNDAFQHLMALIAQQMGEVGALSADIASAASTDLSTARGWFCSVTGTNSISSFGTVPAGKIFRLRFVNGLTLTYNAVSMILPNATNFAAAAGDIVTMLSLGSGNWRFVDYSPAGGGQLPAGSIVDFGGTTAPTGWLLCNGQLISRTGYPLLYAAIGTAYGAGDGSTTFGVPDFRGRAAVGNDTMGSSAAGRITTATITTPSTNGGSGGAQAVALTVAELASHDHGGLTSSENVSHTHTQQGTFGSSLDTPDHLHNYSRYVSLLTTASGAGATNMWQGSATQQTAGESVGHTHTTTLSGQTGAPNTTHVHGITAQGSGNAHTNMPPALIVAKIIKA